VKPNIFIIGIGIDGREGLSARATDFIKSADVLVGGKRHLACFPNVSATKIPIASDLSSIFETLQGQPTTRRIVVLASGDPLFYGIARSFLEHFPKDRVEILPNISAMQWAFAKIKESWEDAFLTSVHGRPLEMLLERMRGCRKVGIFTDPKNTPALIAQFLLERGFPDGKAFICENMGAPDERVYSKRLSQLSDEARRKAYGDVEVSPLNVLIIIFDEKPKRERRILGIPDDEFAQQQPLSGLITKSEIRVLSIAKLHLHEESMVWDIGAGSGSVAIEAALLAKRGIVYAIEKDADSVELIKQNLNRFETHNVRIIHAEAPSALADLPNPDAVFIGGSGGKLESIIDVACQRLRDEGRVALNFATLENLHTALERLELNKFESEVTLVNIARGKPLGNLTRLEPLNPVFIVTAWKASAL